MVNGENIFCFGNVSALAGSDWVVLTENAVSVAKGEADEGEFKNESEKVGDGKLCKFEFNVARDV